MKTIRADLSRELKNVELHTFADWHIGDLHCDMNAIKSEIEEVKSKENAYVICNGDLMNNATKTSVSDGYSEVIPPQKQIEALTELLEPIKDKILMMTQGNHEARTYKNDGIDLTSIVSSNLGILDKYAREGGVLFLRFGRVSRGLHESQHKDKVRMVCYSIYATHGSGGGRKEGAKAVRLADMASIVDCDIYFHAHTHLPMIMKQSFYRVNMPNSSVALTEKLFVNTAATLNYGGYGQTYEFKPSSISNPVVYLDGTRKKYTARL